MKHLFRSRRQLFASRPLKVLIIGDAAAYTVNWVVDSLVKSGHKASVLSFERPEDGVKIGAANRILFGLDREPSIFENFVFLLIANIWGFIFWCHTLHIIDDGKYANLSTYILHPRKILTVQKSAWSRYAGRGLSPPLSALSRLRYLTTDDRDMVDILPTHSDRAVFYTKLPSEEIPNFGLLEGFEAACWRKMSSIYRAGLEGHKFEYLKDTNPSEIGPDCFNILCCDAYGDGTPGKDAPGFAKTKAMAVEMRRRGSLLILSGTPRQKNAEFSKAKYWTWQGAKVGYAFTRIGAAKTIPGHRVEVAPLPNRRVLKWLRKNKIPLGAAWNPAANYDARVQADLGFYKFRSLQLYSRISQKIYLSSFDVVFNTGGPDLADAQPAAKMSRYIPLAPAVSGWEGPKRGLPHRRLQLVYLAERDNNCDLRKLCAAVTLLAPMVELTIFVPESSTGQLAVEILGGKGVSEHIRVKSGRMVDAKQEAQSYDMGVMLSRPDAPIVGELSDKIYDYAALNLPVLATAETLAGRLVTQNDIGWSVEYSVQALVPFLMRLVSQRHLIGEKLPNIATFAYANQWAHRIDEIEKALGVAGGNMPHMDKELEHLTF